MPEIQIKDVSHTNYKNYITWMMFYSHDVIDTNLIIVDQGAKYKFSGRSQSIYKYDRINEDLLCFITEIPKNEKPRECEYIPREKDRQDTFEKYVKSFDVRDQAYILLIKDEVIKAGHDKTFYSQLPYKFFFVFSDGRKLYFSRRSWNDFIVILNNVS